jgi:hypothetical protein
MLCGYSPEMNWGMLSGVGLNAEHLYRISVKISTFFSVHKNVILLKQEFNKPCYCGGPCELCMLKGESKVIPLHNYIPHHEDMGLWV